MQPHPLTHIETRLDFIQSYLEAQYDGDDGNILSQRLQEVGAYMAESGKLKADAEYHYHAKLNSEIMRSIKDLLPDYSSATLQNKFVQSLAKEESRLVTLADRVNRTATHQIESMRTLLSYIKSLPR